ncbi:hypothetical protein ABW21_db0200176 [Orbilia brochopaga]|nr:hypothetical protein ABW21_db0200176 [Drechslerella brochopaga]
MLQAQAALQLNRFTNVRTRALLFHRTRPRYQPLSQMRAATTILRRIVADTVASQRPIVHGAVTLGVPRTLATAIQEPRPRGRPRKVEEPEPKKRGRPRTIVDKVEGPRTRGRPRKVEEEAPRQRGRPRAIAEEGEAPRPRGRPRKVEEEAPRKPGRPKTIVEEVEAPKPRGRPRNVFLEEGDEEASKPRGRPRKVEEEDAPRQRGRPRTIIEEEAEAPKPRGRPKRVVEEEEVSKPRGRPRKASVEDEHEEILKSRGRLQKAILQAIGEEVAKPRGRPRQAILEGGGTVSKPRGRPKVVAVEEAEVLPETIEDGSTAVKVNATAYTPEPIELSVTLNEDEEAAITGKSTLEPSEELPKPRRTRGGRNQKEPKPPAIKGRPRIAGPPLPTQVVIVDGIKKILKFRPGRPNGYRNEDFGVAERPEGTADFSLTREGKGPPHGRPPAAPGPLTLLAMRYLKETKPTSVILQKQLRQNGWYSRAMGVEDAQLEDQADADIEGAENDLNEDEEHVAEAQKWLGTKEDSGGIAFEKWRLPSRKAVKDISPTLEKLLIAKTPMPRNASKSMVLSESKCQQIFDTFDFSEYEGCQILDFNPGFGIFSRALNQAVKPAKHLLFEPEASFVPILSRVCNDRSFKHIQKDMYFWKTFDELVNQGTIAPKNMDREGGLNTSILVTGMLQRDVKGDRFMAQIIDAIGKRDWIFRYGRVKLLLWVDSEVAARYIPRSFGRRNRPAVLAEAFTDVREIAQPTPVYTWSDLRFLNRMDRWKEPGHIPNQQDQVTGVAYADELMYVKMSRKPEAVIFDTLDYWPQAPWAETTLLEFTPKVPESDYLRGLVPNSEPWKFFNFILTTALMSRHNTVREVLAKIGGGTEKMLEVDSELKEMKGLAQKHAVHMSVTELAKLAKAYEFWPWRSPDYFIGSELRLRSAGMLDDEENRW